MKKRISQTYRILCSIQIFKKTVTTNYITSKLLRSGSDSAAYNYEVINNIVKRMDTMLKTPETVFCRQDEDLTKEND
jgi:hypothetical protein